MTFTVATGHMKHVATSCSQVCTCGRSGAAAWGQPAARNGASARRGSTRPAAASCPPAAPSGAANEDADQLVRAWQPLPLVMRISSSALHPSAMLAAELVLLAARTGSSKTQSRGMCVLCRKRLTSSRAGADGPTSGRFRSKVSAPSAALIRWACSNRRSAFCKGLCWFP